MADETTQNESTDVATVGEAAGAVEQGADRGGRGDERPRRRFPRRKVCYFRVTKAEVVDFKDVNVLKKFISESGKILPRRVTGTSAKFQRLVTTAIKRARYMALIPYTSNHR
ncbi:30S ribosomal protein S18 [Candidatus Sumerlaeota bacterium]|nr:30S ribosomal protein S18 [Candidatus Sumerlaeota bacterium]